MFPGVVHLIVKYENNLEEALIQSVMAGGDSAARGMLVGMVLGAHLGPESIPGKWLSELLRRKEIDALLDQIP
jgi:ADP-ribosylglycohydrolase